MADQAVGAGADTALFVWAGQAEDAPAAGRLLLWSGVNRQVGARSLGEFIETHAEELRRRCLAWFQELGELRVRGRALRDHFSFADGSDLWAQSIFVELSPWKQLSFLAFVKVLALELLLELEQPRGLVLAGGDRDLRAAIEQICQRRSIAFAARPAQRRQRAHGLRAWFRAMPHGLQGLLAQAYFAVTRLPLRRARIATPAPTHKSVLLCGPLFNFELKADASFASRFWTRLPDLLGEAGYSVTWLHSYYQHEGLARATEAARLIHRLNADANRSGTHLLVDAFFTPFTAVAILARWARMTMRSLAIESSVRRQLQASDRAGYWPLVRHDWARSLRGVGCVENLFYAACVNEALSALPPQDEGLYLMEGQSWERALAFAWRSHGHGRLAGVAHSTLRFWDLRYHCDPRRYRQREPPAGPAVVILNGP